MSRPPRELMEGVTPAQVRLFRGLYSPWFTRSLSAWGDCMRHDTRHLPAEEFADAVEYCLDRTETRDGRIR